jgi:hypothetical protein
MPPVPTQIEYRHTAYPSAWLAGASGFLYSVSFVIIARNNPSLGTGLSGFFLLIGGVLGASALLGLYDWLKPSNGTYALWALVFGLAGALAATLHGGYDLAVGIHPPNQVINFPSPVDPRGLGTFGLTGLSLLAFSFLMQRDRGFPRGLVWLGYASGVLLLLIYVSRLTILQASNLLVLAPAGIEGFVLNPAWYIWLGFVLRKKS